MVEHKARTDVKLRLINEILHHSLRDISDSKVQTFKQCDAAEDFKALESISNRCDSTLDVQRRAVRIMHLAANLGAGTDWDAVSVADFSRELDGLAGVSLPTSTDSECQALAEGMVKWGELIKQQINDAWEEQLNSSVAELKSACPPKALINNPRLLVDNQLQGQLFNNPSRPKLNDLLHNLNETLRIIKDAEAHKFQISKSLRNAYKLAKEMKVEARTVIGVDYVLDKILSIKQSGTKSRAMEAAFLSGKLQSKGIEHPKYIASVLAKMQEVPK